MGDGADDAERRAFEEEEIQAAAMAEVLEPGQELVHVVEEERAAARPPANVLPSSNEWEATMAVARQIAGTEFVPESYRGRPDSVVAAILTGREMGIGPMQALRQIHMIDGRPAFSADLMLAKMRAGGVVILDSSVSDTGAHIKAKRKDTGEEAEVAWNKDDAEKAGLLGKKNWKTYPADMYWARCVGRLARRLGSDLLGGLVYSSEEMQDWDDGGYGGGSGYEATTAKPFDPETDLMEGAIQGKDAPKAINAALNLYDPTVDWPSVISDVLMQTWNVSGRDELDPKETQDFWRRLSNTVRWIEQAAGDGDIPPVDSEVIKAGFAYAFSGAKVDINYIEVKEPAVISAKQAAEIDEKLKEEDVPFGEEKK